MEIALNRRGAHPFDRSDSNVRKDPELPFTIELGLDQFLKVAHELNKAAIRPKRRSAS